MVMLKTVVVSKYRQNKEKGVEFSLDDAQNQTAAFIQAIRLDYNLICDLKKVLWLPNRIRDTSDDLALPGLYCQSEVGLY